MPVWINPAPTRQTWLALVSTDLLISARSRGRFVAVVAETLDEQIDEDIRVRCDQQANISRDRDARRLVRYPCGRG